MPGLDLKTPFVDCAKRIVIRSGLLEFTCRVGNPLADFRP